jgi:hypothetical protein
LYVESERQKSNSAYESGEPGLFHGGITVKVRCEESVTCMGTSIIWYHETARVSRKKMASYATM